MTRCPDLPSARPLWPAWCSFSIFFFTTTLRNQPLTFVEPHLDADLAVGGARFGEAIIDVRAQRLQRQLAVQVPLRSRNLGAVQPARYANLDPARAEPQSRLDRFA